MIVTPKIVESRARLFRMRLLSGPYLPLLTAGLLMLAAISSARAQEPTPEIAPPPLKMMSQVERSQLSASVDFKARTKLLLELMSVRIAAAERLSAARNYEAMFTELGSFHGLIDDGIQYLKTKDPHDRKVLDTFKRLEIGLRGFAPRIEAIRRDLPLAYEDYVRRLIKYLRAARTLALEPQFADTVLPETKKQ
jgi:hypothetical protein